MQTDGISIAVLMPTRGKPEELRRIAAEIQQTSTDAMLFAYVADDDPKVEEYRAIGRELLDRVHLMFGPPLGFSGGVNALAIFAASYLPQLLLRCEDDFYFYPGWEIGYLGAIPAHGVGMIWCNYVHKGPDAEPQTAAITLKWYKALGWFSLPGITHFFCDNVLGDLAHAIGSATYLPAPFIIHKWNPNDPRKGNHSHLWGHDEGVYRYWLLNGGKDADAATLRQYIDGGAK